MGIGKQRPVKIEWTINPARTDLRLMRHCDVAVGPCRVLHPGPAASRSPSSPHPYRVQTQRNTTPRRAVATSSGRPKPKPRHLHPSRRTSAGPCRPALPAVRYPVALRPSPTEPGRASHSAGARIASCLPGVRIRARRNATPCHLSVPLLRVPPGGVALARTLDTWTQATVDWSSVKKKLDLVARGKVFLQTEASRSRATRAVAAGLELASCAARTRLHVRTNGGLVVAPRAPSALLQC